MIYITGDTHRDFTRFNNKEYTEQDIVIILGDVGLNYYLDIKDMIEKEKLKRHHKNIFFCIRGNHEERCENIPTYKEIDMYGDKVYIEEEYPNIIFAKDGGIYNIEGNTILTIGGAYSIDKPYRLLYGYNWFKDEQLTNDEMNNIFNKIKDKHFDIVLTHTCPYKYEPKEVFIEGLDQSKVDKSMEHFLDKVEENITYNKWYCGHYHTCKQVDNIEFMFQDIKELQLYTKNDTLVYKK